MRIFIFASIVLAVSLVEPAAADTIDVDIFNAPQTFTAPGGAILRTSNTVGGSSARVIAEEQIPAFFRCWLVTPMTSEQSF
jgi:hypothetical protein